MSIAAGLSALLFLLLFLAPLVTGIVLLVLARRGGVKHPSCGQCGYDVTTSVGTVDRCPECDTPFIESGVVTPRQGRRPVMFGIGLALVIVSVSCFGLMFVGALFTATRSTTVAPAAPTAPAQPAATTEPAPAEPAPAPDQPAENPPGN